MKNKLFLLLCLCLAINANAKTIIHKCSFSQEEECITQTKILKHNFDKWKVEFNNDNSRKIWTLKFYNKENYIGSMPLFYFEMNENRFKRRGINFKKKHFSIIFVHKLFKHLHDKSVNLF